LPEELTLLEEERNSRQFITSCSVTVVVKTTREEVQVETKKLSRENLQETREENWNIYMTWKKKKEKRDREKKDGLKLGSYKTENHC